MSFAVQLDKVVRAQTLDPASIGVAVVIALVMGAGWAFVAGWVRTKLLPSLADEYARNIQVAFGAFSLILIGATLYKVFAT